MAAVAVRRLLPTLIGLALRAASGAPAASGAVAAPGQRVVRVSVAALSSAWGAQGGAQGVDPDGEPRASLSAEKALKFALRNAQREAAPDEVGAASTFGGAGGSSSAAAPAGALCEAERGQIADAVLAVAALRARHEHLLAVALRGVEPRSEDGPSAQVATTAGSAAAIVRALSAASRAHCLLAVRAAEAAVGGRSGGASGEQGAAADAAESASQWLSECALRELGLCGPRATPTEAQNAAASLGRALAATALWARAPEHADGRGGGAGLWPSDPVERLCAQHSLPRWLVLLWLRSEPFASLGRAGGAAHGDGDDGDAGAHSAAALRAVGRLAAACNERGPLVLRANGLRGSRASLLAQLAAEGVRAQPTDFSPCGVRLPDGRPAGARGGGVRNLDAWLGGGCETQDEGSQLIALATRAAPGQRVLDLCAGNGGKALALAALMRGRGAIVAHDVDGRRLAQLGGRARRAAVPDGLIHIAHGGAQLALAAAALGRPGGGKGAGGARGGPFDAVLVDAPCSSSGVLRRHPSLRWELAEEACTAALPALQRRLLAQGAALLAPGGTLVYATCALSAAENEQVADWLQATHARSLEPLPFGSDEPMPRAGDGAEGGVAGRAHMAWLLPHVHGTDGFFVARWRLRDGPASSV